MEDNFLKHWFEGFGRSLQRLDDESRIDILRECGKACSDSYTKQIYLNEHKASKNFEAFLNRLKARFPEIGFELIEGNEMVELTYNYCACDLVRREYVKTPLLCECSRQSLLYNWSSVFGQGRITVQLKQSILQGDSSCKFLIYISNT